MATTNNTITHLIADFDGVFTDIKKEAAGFCREYPKIFCERINKHITDVMPALLDCLDTIVLDIDQGFIFNGQDVVRAACDPYLRIQKAVQLYLPKVNPEYYPDKDKFMTEIYLEAIKRAGNSIELRKGTKEFLNKILDKYKLAIVTNSSTKKVDEYLSTLGDYRDRMIIKGGANKLVNVPDFEEVPAAIERNKRIVLLRRKNYYEILKSLEKEGFEPQNTAVIGDIYELDLALPEFLGYKAIQITTPYTPGYEIHNTPAGKIARDYGEVLRLLER